MTYSIIRGVSGCSNMELFRGFFSKQADALFTPPSCLAADTVHTGSTTADARNTCSGRFLLMSRRCMAATRAYEDQRGSKIDTVGSEGP